MQKAFAAVEPEIRGRADEFQYLSYRFGIQFFDDLFLNVKQVVQELEGKKPENKIPSPPKRNACGRGRGRAIKQLGKTRRLLLKSLVLPALKGNRKKLP